MGMYSDKSAVITGGGAGMGFALAKLLVDGGARVVITGRSRATLDAARALGENAVAVRGDVASVSDLDALADRVEAELGTIEALFVNAGIAATTPCSVSAPSTSSPGRPHSSPSMPRTPPVRNSRSTEAAPSSERPSL